MIKSVSGFFDTKWQTVKQFDEKSERNRRVSYYTMYTIIFAAVAAVVFSWFYMNGKSFVWGIDGLTQHYNSLVYFGVYCRQIIRDLLSTGSINIPMWDFNIGYGSDIITTLHYYVIGDPLDLLTVIVPSSRTELLYSALVILRLYLSGAAFSIYCRKMGKGRFATLCGAFTYAFCGYVLFASVRHPFFINPMIYLPLLLTGVEKILEKKKPYLFIIMVFISAVSNFYFFYMIGIVVVLYVLIRMFFMYKGRRIRNMMVNLLKFAGYTATGVLMACMIFLPNIIELTSTQRMNVELEYDILYNAAYYQKFLSGFITAQAPGSWSYMGYTAISLVALVLLFSVKRKNKELKSGFILLTLFLLIPVAGRVINGFSYVSNRWVWGYSFVIAMILVTMIPSMFTITKKQIAAVSVFASVYLAVCLLFRNIRSERFLASFSIFLVAVIFMYAIYILRTRPEGFGKYGRSLSRAGIFVLVISGIVVQAGFNYSYNEDDYISSFHSFGRAYSDLADTEAKAVSKINDESFFRFNENRFGGQDVIYNSSLVNHVNGTNYFFSLANGNVSSFMRELAFDNEVDCRYKGTDNRTAPSTLGSVKYFVVKSGLQNYLPYGHSNQVSSYKSNKTTYLVYENEYVLPLGYTYSSYLPRDKYEKLTPLQKQQGLLQNAVIDGAVSGLTETEEPILNDIDIPYTVKCADGIKYEDGKFTVTKASAKATLVFDGISNSETYFYFNNIRFTSINPMDIYSDDELEKMSVYDRNVLRSKYKYWVEPTEARFTVTSGDVSKSGVIQTPKFIYYADKHNLLVNLCYGEEAKSEIILSFNTIGEYTLDDMQVICQPMDDYAQQVKALKEDVMEDIVIGTNTVSGTISLDTGKLLCLTIPYSDGWTAYVNGEKAELLRTNTMYTGLLLEPGNNQKIELFYTTPGLKYGFIFSAAGIILFIGIIVYFKIRKRKNAIK